MGIKNKSFFEEITHLIEPKLDIRCRLGSEPLILIGPGWLNELGSWIT
jgi:hypothetical protein